MAVDFVTLSSDFLSSVNELPQFPAWSIVECNLTREFTSPIYHRSRNFQFSCWMRWREDILRGLNMLQLISAFTGFNGLIICYGLVNKLSISSYICYGFINNCIPRTKYVRGILWFSRRYASASAFHRLRDNFKKPYRIASIFYM